MSRTWHESKQLRTTEQKVEDLGDEEEEERLRVVALDCDDSEGHAGKVAEGISRECPSRIPSRDDERDDLGSENGRTSYGR